MKRNDRGKIAASGRNALISSYLDTTAEKGSRIGKKCGSKSAM